MNKIFGKVSVIMAIGFVFCIANSGTIGGSSGSTNGTNKGASASAQGKVDLQKQIAAQQQQIINQQKKIDDMVKHSAKKADIAIEQKKLHDMQTNLESLKKLLKKQDLRYLWMDLPVRGKQRLCALWKMNGKVADLKPNM